MIWIKSGKFKNQDETLILQLKNMKIKKSKLLFYNYPTTSVNVLRNGYGAYHRQTGVNDPDVL